MLRRILVVFMSLSLCWTAIACGSTTTVNQPQQTFKNNVASVPNSISDGKYPIQQATYDDATGEYSLMLLNTPSGTPPILQTANIQMARLSDEEIAQGEKSYLKVDNNQPVMYITEDFKIEYVHNVTETQTNPQTGRTETVVVRRESNFWTPFAGALAGQAIGSLLFRPQYYVPPVYQPGGVLTGYGGYGSSYSQAVDRYQDRYKAPPAAVKNRQTLRTTGSVRSTRTSDRLTKPRTGSNRATGSGVGSSTLRSSGKTRVKSSPRSSFGSSRGGFGSRSSGIRTRGFGSIGGFRRR